MFCSANSIDISRKQGICPEEPPAPFCATIDFAQGDNLLRYGQAPLTY